MLSCDEFPTAHLSTLTEQINNWLGNMIRNGQLRADKAVASYDLGEQFLMASLSDPQIHAVKSLDRDLGDLVLLTGRRHHQLKYERRAVAYARSLVAKDESLCQLFRTKLASKVQEAITWLDGHETIEFAAGSWRVRLVTVPTFHTHAFLIQKLQDGSDVAFGDSYVLVVSAPDWLDRLPQEKLLTSREFLLGFKDETPIIGLRANNDFRDSKPMKQRSARLMPDDKDANTEVVTEGDAPIGGDTGSNDTAPMPIFESFIYDFVSLGVGGDPGGRPGTIGGPIGGQAPKFRVLTYQFMPSPVRNIDES